MGDHVNWHVTARGLMKPVLAQKDTVGPPRYSS